MRHSSAARRDRYIGQKWQDDDTSAPKDFGLPLASTRFRARSYILTHDNRRISLNYDIPPDWQLTRTKIHRPNIALLWSHKMSAAPPHHARSDHAQPQLISIMHNCHFSCFWPHWHFISSHQPVNFSPWLLFWWEIFFSFCLSQLFILVFRSVVIGSVCLIVVTEIECFSEPAESFGTLYESVLKHFGNIGSSVHWRTYVLFFIASKIK